MDFLHQKFCETNKKPYLCSEKTERRGRRFPLSVNHVCRWTGDGIGPWARRGVFPLTANGYTKRSGRNLSREGNSL